MSDGREMLWDGERRAVEGRERLELGVVWIGAAGEEPGDHLVVSQLRRHMQRSSAVAIAGANECGVGSEQRDGGFVIAIADGVVDLLLHG